MAEVAPWGPGTECIGKYNFPGSAAHVSWWRVGALVLDFWRYWGDHSLCGDVREAEKKQENAGFNCCCFW